MEYAAIVAGLALIAYGANVMRRPWGWYLVNEAEPFDWLPFGGPDAVAADLAEKPRQVVRVPNGLHHHEPTPADFQYAGEWRDYLNSRPDSKDLADQMRAARNVAWGTVWMDYYGNELPADDPRVKRRLALSGVA